ncbi:hypothetical protein [Granulosicoccus antarcticus]|uniref:2-nonaprenyl-3-methyl-6-methoxy-1,4-benzoquinol hydroxylase n=1 Tax=Granulosicoccus antarcticus IMCC3135 TaxID=1192854 RepID=A0A2Z2NQG6_9GAMM|nr:hypothetical protein [Granulosicoccus antarcticus]ASJ73573.1 hypothetical protein IMCC3135_17460 [Granulosicoccus antarcticus IMCC3135]
MRFSQVKELVSWAADYHAQLASSYTVLAAGPVSQRVSMALRYLAEHERAMQASLAQYLNDDSEHHGVLDTWFDDATDFPHVLVLNRLSKGMSSVDMQTVLSMALATHRTLQDLYAHRAECAATSAEKEFFEALLGGHEGEVRRLSRDMQRLEDY